MRSEWGKLRSRELTAVVFLVVTSAATLDMKPLHAQVQGSSVPHIPSASSGSRSEDGDKEDDPFTRRQREKQVEARNAQRQEQLVKDTARLLQLATELKANVDKSNKNTLSLDVIKKAEEIEKLAKSVREKMRD